MSENYEEMAREILEKRYDTGFLPMSIFDVFTHALRTVSEEAELKGSKKWYDAGYEDGKKEARAYERSKLEEAIKRCPTHHDEPMGLRQKSVIDYKRELLEAIRAKDGEG